MAARWLGRWLAETRGPTIEDAVMVAGCLAALGGSCHENAVWLLREILAGGSALAACRERFLNSIDCGCWMCVTRRDDGGETRPSVPA